MEPWLDELMARGLRNGGLTIDELNKAFPGDLTPDQLQQVLELLDSQGIKLVEDTPDDFEAISARLCDASAAVYRPDAAFGEWLRANGVVVSDVMSSFESVGTVFDAVLIVPGEAALESWRRLREQTARLKLYPVIKGAADGPRFDREPHPLDPGGRYVRWEHAWRKDRKRPVTGFRSALV